jgi:hypothetical protein
VAPAGARGPRAGGGGRDGLSDGVVGLALAVEAARAARAPQSDLFDRGAASAAAAERAIARLVEDGLGQVIRPCASAHVLPEQRLSRDDLEVEAAVRAMAVGRRWFGPWPPRRPARAGSAPGLGAHG